jgi:hypothetical protein
VPEADSARRPSYLAFASGLATSRARSTKRSTAGLKVRFLSVTIKAGRRGVELHEVMGFAALHPSYGSTPLLTASSGIRLFDC